MSKIIVVTEVPRFSDVGAYQQCVLVSADEEFVFYIPWHFTQQAMPACGAVLDKHREKARNTPLKGKWFKRKRGEH